MLTIPFDPSAEPFDANSHSLFSRVDYHPVGCGYIVPEASHPNVTVGARSGRVLVAENKDVSFVHQLSMQLRVARGCLTNEPPTATFSIKTGSKQLECSRNEQIPHIFDGLIPKLSSFGSVLSKIHG